MKRPPKKKKDPAAVALGKLRQAKLTPEERSDLGRLGHSKRKVSKKRAGEIASIAARAYWDGLNPEERSAEMRKRAAKRKSGAGKPQPPRRF